MKPSLCQAGRSDSASFPLDTLQTCPTPLLNLEVQQQFARMKTKLLLCLLSLAMAVAAFAEGKRIWAKSVLNQKGPDFVVEKWLTPEPDRKGKFVLVDFWATWCGPCRKAIPELNSLQKKFADKLVVIGVSDETEDKVRAMASPKIEYAVAIDSQKRMYNTLEVKGIPHVILMDPTGIVRWEGYPLLEEDPLTEKAVADVIAKYSK